MTTFYYNIFYFKNSHELFCFILLIRGFFSENKFSRTSAVQTHIFFPGETIRIEIERLKKTQSMLVYLKKKSNNFEIFKLYEILLRT